MLGDLEASGVALFAISYDPVGALARFADAHGIRFPLLSDEGSAVIRELGLLNTRLEQRAVALRLAHPERYRGVSYPAVFLVDRNGRVADRRWHQDDHVRDSGRGLLEDLLGIAVGPADGSVRTAGKAVDVRAFLDSPTFTHFQRLQLIVELIVAPDHHVYASPAPEGVVPLTISVDPGPYVTSEEVRVGPPARWIELDGDRVPVHEGTLRCRVPVTFWRRPAGCADALINVDVTFQACSDRVCLEPEAIRLEVPAHQAPLVDAFEHGVWAADRSAFYAVVVERSDTTVRIVDPRSGAKTREVRLRGRYDLPAEPATALSADGRRLTLRALSEHGPLGDAVSVVLDGSDPNMPA